MNNQEQIYINQVLHEFQVDTDRMPDYWMVRAAFEIARQLAIQNDRYEPAAPAPTEDYPTVYDPTLALEMLEALKVARDSLRAWNRMNLHGQPGIAAVVKAYESSPEMQMISAIISRAELSAHPEPAPSSQDQPTKRGGQYDATVKCLCYPSAVEAAPNCPIHGTKAEGRPMQGGSYQSTKRGGACESTKEDS